MPDPHPHWLKPHHLLLLIVVNLIWGANMLGSKLGVRELPAILFSCLRVAIILMVCAPWLRRVPGQMTNLLKGCLLTGVGGYGFMSLGLALSKDVSTVAVFAQLVVPFSALLSVLMLGEVIHWRRKTGIALAFCGAIFIGFDPRAFSYLPGLICIVLHAICASLGMIYIKRVVGVGPMAMLAWMAATSLPVLLLLSLLLEHNQVAAMQAASGTAWSAVLFSAIASSLIGQAGFFYLLQRYPVNSVAPLSVLATVFGMMLGELINHDVLTRRMLFGATMTLLGVLIIELRTKSTLMPPAAGATQGRSPTQ